MLFRGGTWITLLTRTLKMILHALYCSLWVQVLLLMHYHVARCQQRILYPRSRLRNTTLEDADDIASIIITAFSSLPSWESLSEFREDFLEEHRGCIRAGVAQLLADVSAHFVVIEAPTNSDVALVAAATVAETAGGDLAIRVAFI
jgi:hypothetical protein